MSPEVVEVVVKATCILHNFICWHSADEEDTGNTALGTELSAGMQGITQVGSNNASREALAVRERFATYFSSSAGEVSWQHAAVA